MKNTILAIETASSACSVALISAKHSVTRFVLTQKEHTQLLLPMVKALLEEADVSLEAIDAVAVGRGPGSFTGVRIGISAAQGLAFGLELPVYPISTLEALCAQGVKACSEMENAMVVPALDARMHEIYSAAYTLKRDRYALAVPEQLFSPSHLLDKIESDTILALGSGFDVYWDDIMRDHADKKVHFLPNRFPDALQIGLIAQKMRQQGNKGISATAVEPRYIRDKVAHAPSPEIKVD